MTEGPVGLNLPGLSQFSLVGRGGFSRVYRAHQAQFAREVAVKVLDVDALDERAQRRFIRECQATGRLGSHPNIVSVFEASVSADGHPYIVMEYCAKGSLASKAAAEGFLASDEVVVIGSQMARALSAAHQAGVLHRDIKPANILITQYGQAALADFGISAASDSSRSVGTEALTIDFAPPEILNGHAADARSDLYSLGVTLFTLLNGTPPYWSDERPPLAQQLMRILRDPVPVLNADQVGPGLSALVRALMDKEPSARPQSSDELVERFASLDQTGSESIAPVVAPAASPSHDTTVLRPRARPVEPLAPTPLDAGETVIRSVPRDFTAHGIAVADQQLIPATTKFGSRSPRLLALALLSVTAVGGLVALVLSHSGSKPNDSSHGALPTSSDIPALTATRASTRYGNTGGIATCSYTQSGTAARTVDGIPPTTGVRNTGTQRMKFETTRGTIIASLLTSKAPCTVNSLVFLAQQGFYDNTPCPRVVNSGIFVLQCGDPSGTTSGGPGYTFADENLTGATYPAGTLAMANSGGGASNGSQFFMVFKDTQLPASYTPFGTITSGLDVLKKVAAAGDDGSNSAGGGKPKLSISLTKVTLAQTNLTKVTANPRETAKK